jgi:hypothetical protein
MEDLLDLVAEPSTVPDVTVPIRLKKEGNVTAPIQQEMSPPCGPLRQRSAGEAT